MVRFVNAFKKNLLLDISCKFYTRLLSYGIHGILGYVYRKCCRKLTRNLFLENIDNKIADHLYPYNYLKKLSINKITL